MKYVRSISDLTSLEFYMHGFALHVDLDGDLSFYTIDEMNAASTFGRIVRIYIAERIGTRDVISSAPF